MYQYVNARNDLRGSRTKSEIVIKMKRYNDLMHPFINRFERHHSMFYLDGRKMWRIGNKQEAISLMELSALENPYDRQSWYELGRMYSSMQNNDKASRSYLRALDLCRSDIESSLGLVKLAIKFNDLTLFNKAMENYHNKLYKLFEEHYSDKILNFENKNAKRFWAAKCRQIDLYQSLLHEWDSKKQVKN